MGPDFPVMTSALVITLSSVVFVLIAGKAFERKG
jgi:hypothetical protein